jgi:hypothetical protein
MMHRRDVFTLLFKSSSFDEPIVMEPNPVISAPVHLCTDGTVSTYREWTAFPADGRFTHDVVPDYGFSTRFHFVYSKAIQNVGLLVGLKAKQEQSAEPVKVGLDVDGCLFIGPHKTERKLPAEQLIGDMKLIMEISPRENDKAFVKLKILDNGGLTLSTLKTDSFKMTDFSGDIGLLEQSYGGGKAVKWSFLKIEGRKLENN